MRASGQTGFTYLGLIIFVAIIGLVGAATLKIGSLMQRAAAEEELLEIGAAFSAALDSYAAATPPGASPYPPSIEQLLKDPRSPAVRRHLRKVYVDPVTGKAEWGIVHAGGGQAGIVAFHSLSDARPLKVANFDDRFRGLDNKRRISEWRFSAGERSLAPVVTPAGAAAPAAPQPQAQTEARPEAQLEAQLEAQPEAQPEVPPEPSPAAPPEAPSEPESEPESGPEPAPEPAEEDPAPTGQAEDGPAVDRARGT